MRAEIVEAGRLEKAVTLNIDGVEVTVDQDDIDPRHTKHVVDFLISAAKQASSFASTYPTPMEDEGDEWEGVPEVRRR